ncbi:restriction endonuclease subunit S, partial [Shewanella sp. SM78]
MVPNGWEYKKLGVVAELQRGFDLPSAKRLEGSVPIISSGGLSGYHNEVKVKAPGIVTGRYGSIGDVFFVQEDFWPLNTALWVKNFHGNDPKFIYYLLTSFDFKKFSDKTGVPGVNRNDLHAVKVGVPPLREQQKIAKILSAWDKAIVTTEKLISTSKQQKKALMQQLFTGKKRFLDPETGKAFEGEWEEVQLDEISDITTGSSNREDSSLDGEFTFFDRSEDIRTSSRYLFDSEAVIVAGEGQDFVPKYFKGKFDLHQRTYAIINIENAIGKFLYFYIGYNRHYFLAQAVGSTVKSLRLPMFKKMPIILPCLEEQQRIASVLTAADKEIELLQTKLAHFK